MLDGLDRDLYSRAYPPQFGSIVSPKSGTEYRREGSKSRLPFLGLTVSKHRLLPSPIFMDLETSGSMYVLSTNGSRS